MPHSAEIDDDTRDLVERILTHAGTMMEDASVLALLPSVQKEPLTETIGRLEKASSTILVLIGAAMALARE